MGEVATFSASDLTANLQGKIRTLIADSLPEEAINGLITTEITKFFNPRTDYHGKPNGDSEFALLIKKLVGGELSEKIRASIGQLTQAYWNSHGKGISDALLEQSLRSMAYNFMEGYFQGMTANALSTFQTNYRPPGY